MQWTFGRHRSVDRGIDRIGVFRPGGIIVHGVYSPLRAQALAFLALAYVGLLTANVETRATAAVDFSGRWVLESAAPVRPGYEQFWLGTEATITQTPSSLSVRRLTPLPQRDARFPLDRDETQNEYVVNGQRPDVSVSHALP